jgi:hypothetical protein
MKIEPVCKQIVSALVKDGYLHQVRKKDVEEAIMQIRQCIDSRTVNQWIKALLTFHYLAPEGTPNLFKINPIKIPELMVMIHEKAQTKLQ